jgi:hypothetical protein
MKIRFYLCTGALLLACVAIGFAQDEASTEYAKLMTPAVMANAALQKSAKTGDLAAAASSAADTEQAFAKIEQYWTTRGTPDAQKFARNIEQDAKMAHAAAAAGKKDSTRVAATKIAANCEMCHMAHRIMFDDGTFKLK